MASHLIEKQIFQFGLEREELLEPVSRELNLLMQGDLLSAMDEILSGVGPKDSVMRVPRMELNLGVISFSEFAEVFSARFQEKLRELLTHSAQESLFKSLQMEGADRSLELLRAFFTTGQNPWWASKNEQDYDAMIRALIAPRRQSTRELVLDTAVLPLPRRRIIYTLKEDTLYRVFDILSPDPEQFFRKYVEDLIRVNRFKRIAKEEERKVKYVIQELILLYLVVHKDTSLDQLYFLRYQLMHFARHYRIAYPSLLKYIHQALKYYGLLDQQGGIGPLIQSLYAESKIPGALKSLFTESGVLDSLQTFLMEGFFTGQHFAGSQSQVFNLLFAHALRHQPEALRAMIFQTGKNQRVRRRLINLLSEEAVKKMFRLLAPSLLETIYAYFQLTEHVMAHTPAVNQEKIAYRKTVQELTLKVIVENLRGETDNQVFLRNQLTEYSLRFGIALPILLALLLADLNALKVKSHALNKLEEAIHKIYLTTTGEVFQAGITDLRLASPVPSVPAKTSKDQTLRVADMERLLRLWLIELNNTGILSVLATPLPLEVAADSPQTLLDHLLAQWAGPSREKQRLLARTLFIQGFASVAGKKSGFSSQMNSTLDLLQVVGFSGALGFPEEKAFESFLTFLGAHPKLLSPKYFEGIFRRIGFPRVLQFRWISRLAELLKYKNSAEIQQWSSLIEDYPGISPSLKEKIWRFLALRMVQEKTSRPEFQVLIRESAELLASSTAQPIEVVLAQILKNAQGSVSPRLTAQLQGAVKSRKSLLRMPVTRITLAEFLELLGSDVQGLSEEELDVLLVEEWLSRPAAMLERLRNLRHHPALLALLFENLSVSESEILMKELLGTQFEAWLAETKYIQKVHRELGLFRQLPTELPRAVFAASLDFFLSGEPVWSDVQEFYHFLFERWQLAGQLDFKLTSQVLAEEEKALSLPTPMRLALMEIIGSRNIQPLHVSVLAKQREEDLLLFWIRHDQMPEWADNKEVALERVIQRLNAAEPEFAARLVQAALTGGTEERLAEWLGVEGRTRLWRVLRPAGTGLDLGWWFDNLMPYVGLLKPEWSARELPQKWFGLLLKARVWAFRHPEEMGQWLQLEFGNALNKLVAKDTNSELADILKSALPAFASKPKRSFDEVGEWLRIVQNFLLGKKVAFEGQEPDWNQLPIILAQWPDVAKREFWQSLRIMMPASDSLRRFASRFAPATRMQWMMEQAESMPLTSAFLSQIRKLNLSNANWNEYWPFVLESLFLKPSGDKLTARRLIELFQSILPQKSPELFQSLDKEKGSPQAETLMRLLLLVIPTSGTEWGRQRDKEMTLQYYLQFGTLPTAYEGWTMAKLRGAFLELLSTGGFFARRLLFQAWKLRTSRTFLVQLLQPDDFGKVAEWIHPALPELLKKLDATLKKAGNPPLAEVFRWENPLQMAELLLNLWTKDRSVFADPDVVVKSVFIHYSQALRLLPRLLIHQVNSSPTTKTEEEKRIWKRVEEMVILEEKRVGEEQPEAVEEILESGESIHLYNAGLCLIWPFVGRLFRLLDMVDGNDFKNEELRVRAVQLTQYIVTGSEETPEAELSLNKVLCGMDLGYPVEPTIQITEAEQNMVESMLRGVLQNWEKMQGTSVPTFRDTFLKREGRLSRREGLWELVVEKRAYDVLLTTLPWQIRTIKLAWMPMPLQVAWV